MMAPSGRGLAIMKVVESKRMAPPPMEDGPTGGAGDAMEAMCEQGLSMAKEYLSSEEGQNSPLRPKVEALAAAFEDLLSSVEKEPEEG